MAGAMIHNLPLQLSAFIGREQELAEIRQWLAACRLVTLTGAGGAGKTRLALQTAANLLPTFAGGAWLIDLTPVADGALVVQAAATVMGVREQPARVLAETLTDHLRSRQVLLILDNCEHLVAACAELAALLLQACPGLCILATSREPLGVAGEVAWPVPPLSLPAAQPWHDPASGEAALSIYRQSEAVRLFTARAMAVSPPFSLSIENGTWVAEICRRLDGMPLAIELAAARVRALSVREIAQRLDDRFRLLTGGSRTAPPRQQTLAATLDWSYKLLADAERRVLQRIAVFAGGCTLAAAEAVCSDKAISENEVLDVLSRLVDKSLVMADQNEDGTRYRLLETIRQYARLKLLESGEEDRVQERHFGYFVECAEQAETYLKSPHQLDWLRRYETEHDNLRAAMYWSFTDRNRAAASLRLVAACGRFWRVHGYLSEGSAHLVRALASEGAQAPTMTRARALSFIANLNYLRSDYPAMRPYAEEALSIWRGLGEAGRSGLAFTLDLLGELATEEGDYEYAPLLFQEALTIYQGLNDVRGVSDVYMQFGWAAMRTGDYPQATTHLEKFLALAQQSGDLANTAFAYSGLGEVAVRQGHYDEAVTLLNESLRLNRARRDKWGVATGLGTLGWVGLLQHNDGRMRTSLSESLSIRLEIGDQGGIAWCLEKLADAALVQGEAANLGARLERYQTAACIFGAAAAIRAPLKSVIDPADQPAYERNVATLRMGLGEPAFAAAWAAGAAMAIEAAARYALAEPPPGYTSQPQQDAPAAEQFGGLTMREREVVILIAQGKTNREIAQAMTIGVKTVETYITRILNKLGFDSRVQVATWAMEKGLAGSSHTPNS